MKTLFRFVLFVALTTPATAQVATPLNAAQFLGFENGTAGSFPTGWTSNTSGCVVTDA